METSNEKYFSIEGLSPYYLVHPGELLGEELKERGISQKAFAEKIGIQPSHLCALIHGARSFTPSVSAKIESGLPGISADYWMRMQDSYNVDARRRKVNPSRLVSGYVHQQGSPVQAMNDPSVPYREHLLLQLSIPREDKELLSSLAARLGWAITEGR